MGYSQDEIDEILKRYSGESSNTKSTPTPKPVEEPRVVEEPKVVERPIVKEEPKVEKPTHLTRAEIIKQQSKNDVVRKAEEKQRMRKRKTAILNCLLVFFILVFLGSGGYLRYYFYNIKKSQDSFDDLKALITDDGNSGGSGTGTGTAGEWRWREHAGSQG